MKCAGIDSRVGGWGPEDDVDGGDGVSASITGGQVLDEQRHRLRKVVAEAVVVVFFEARALEARLNHRH